MSTFLYDYLGDNMKIDFIGTGSIFSKNNSASYLINDNILLDIPNGTCKSLKRLGKNVCDIKYIFITHFHGDHFLDIPFLLSEIYVKGSKKITLIGTSELKEKVESVTRLVFPNSYEKYLNELDITYIDSKKIIGIDKFDVESINVSHGRMKDAIGYIFKFDGKTVSFTGDTALCRNVENLCEISDYIFIDTTNTIKNDAHICVEELRELAKKYKSTKFIPVHKNDNIDEELIKINLENIIIKKDGDIIKI